MNKKQEELIITNKGKYIAPGYLMDAFTCPNCSTLSKHDWHGENVNETYGTFGGRHNLSSGEKVHTLYICKCQCCEYVSFWYKEKLIWPLSSNIPAPIQEMPEDIKKLYNEARSIINNSPKGACAILRLALQRMCNRLVDKEENSNLDAAIGELVNRGLSQKIQKMMDYIRIVGNEAVHPGTINVDDNIEIAIAMFDLMNLIIEKMIIEPKQIDDLYSILPEEKLNGISNRQRKKKEN